MCKPSPIDESPTIKAQNLENNSPMDTSLEGKFEHNMKTQRMRENKLTKNGERENIRIAIK
jgi:hypothetical protein